MAGVSVSTLIDSLKRSINSPGEDLFTDAIDDDYQGYLEDAFWDCRIAGLLEEWTMTADVIYPNSGTTDITRDLLQVVVLFASITIVTNELKSLNTSFSAKAGPVEFETQNSATLLRDLLKELQERRAVVMRRLSDLGVIKDVMIDGVQARTTSLDYLNDWWTR